jgi:hypothetical protein
MSENRRRTCQPSQYQKQLLDVIDLYIDETGHTSIDLGEVVQWARANGHLELPAVDINKILTRALARVSRNDHVEDENGEPVRRRHAYKIRQGDIQLTFWFRMEDGTPDQMRLSMQQRRKGIAADVFQAERDVKYYNAHYNPGDPIPRDWNFNADVSEREHSSEYDDTPPEEDEVD